MRINSNRAHPNDAAACYNFGVALWEKGDVEAAIAEFRAALHIDPNIADVERGKRNISILNLEIVAQGLQSYPLSIIVEL